MMDNGNLGQLMGTYQIETFGCQMNEHDSERIAGILTEAGYHACPEGETPDILVINTCCVRESAESRIIGHIGKSKELKEKHPQLRVVVCGCMVQQEGMAERLQKRFPHIDAILGTFQLPRLREFLWQKDSLCDVRENEGPLAEDWRPLRRESFRAQLSIMYGCNNFCSYCIVPYVRGRERSRQPEDILHEVRGLAEAGCHELLLLGQNVNSYGKDLPGNEDFSSLLRKVAAVEGIDRIRYMTSHPRDFSDRLIETIAETPQVCPHFHLPAQSGCDRILACMNRGYSTAQYEALLAKIRARFPKACITTDIIVGFPGETEEDFADTLAFLRRCRFDAAYTFIYSRRSGTPAAEMPDQLPESVKRERLQRLMDVQNEISYSINQTMIGKTLPVLVEGPSQKDPAIYSARTPGNKLLLLKAEPEMIGQVFEVRVTAAKTWYLSGELLS